MRREPMMKTPEKVLRALSDGRRILLCAHVGPDGDTLGAALALAEALRAQGKEVRLTCEDPVPALYAFLPAIETFCLPEILSGAHFDTAVAVDVADIQRLGTARALFDAAPQRVVIDHHPTNNSFGLVNWVEPEASATGVMVLSLISQLGVSLSTDMADCLYTALSTDTGHFSFRNTDAQTMHAAGELMDAGAQPARLTGLLYRTRSRAGVELLGRALVSLRFSAAQRVATMILTAQDFAQTGAAEDMTEGIVNYAIEVRGVAMAAVLRESAQGGIKCSLRARAPHNVSAIAQRFGGGGHVSAAGCTLRGSIEEACEQLTSAMELALRQAEDSQGREGLA